MTKETKEKISISNKGHVSFNKNKHLSIETKEKISLSHKGKYKIITKFGGHKKQRQDGYIEVYCPTNINANKQGYVMEHDLIIEETIKRPLKKDEVVHHINHIRNDNRIENLRLMTFKEHARMHMLERYANKKEGVMTY